MKLKVFIADDDSSIRSSLKFCMGTDEYVFREASSIEDAWKELVREPADILLLDMHFPDGSGVDLYRRLIGIGLEIPTIIISGAATATEAAESIKLGVYDYLEKPIDRTRLVITIQRCLEHSQFRRILKGETKRYGSTDFIGRSSAAQQIRAQINQFAARDVKILITGETGTGKEVAASSIWRNSARASRPMVVVNSAAVPESLIESELFGHKRGSFTGAVGDQEGKLELAHRGTLFLDEVGDLSLSAQTKLLRFLETGEIQKVGSNHVTKVDVRLIAATSRELESEVTHGRFRSDLYYRLNVIRIHLPPLRDRKEDIGELFSYFVAEFAKKFETGAKRIDSSAIDLLQSLPWSGNVRELRNAAERATLQSALSINSDLMRKCLGLPIETNHPPVNRKLMTLREYKESTEIDYIQSVLRSTDGSITRAAEVLDIDRSYLHSKINKFGIKRNP
jgi:two-component system nitrogen regulation response regulator NtrX